MSRSATAASSSKCRVAVLAAALGLTIPLGLGAVNAQSTSVPAAGATPGSVFSMTNDPLNNQITAFDRAPDGSLTRRGAVTTGGRGTGGAEDSANGLILTNVDGEASPTNLKGAPKFLIALNGASNDISVFENTPAGLRLVEREPSGGNRPISITVNRGVAYVLNAEEFMCTGLGTQPSITGFSFDGRGNLTPIPGSTRFLSGLLNPGCTQVAFDKTGAVVIVDEQQSDVITTYTRRPDGTLSGPTAQQTTGNGPFGLTFTQRNQLLTTENFGALPGQGSLAAYDIDARTGTLTPLGPTVRNGQSDTCWVAITEDNSFAFTSSFGDDGGISSYRVQSDGTLTLLNTQAATVGSGSSDVALSANSRYLYVKNTLLGNVTAFRIESDGALTRIDVEDDDSLTGSIGLAAT